MTVAPELSRFAGRWRRGEALVLVARVAALLLPLAAIVSLQLRGASPLPGVGVLAGVALATVAGVVGTHLMRRRRRVDLGRVVRYLDDHVDELERSSGLLLLGSGELPLVQRLQRARIEGRLEAVGRLRPPVSVVREGVPWLLAAALAALLVSRLPAVPDTFPESVPPPPPVVAERLSIGRIVARIEPPAYTGLRPSEVTAVAPEVPEVAAPVGATLHWRVATSGNPVRVVALFDEAEARPLERAVDPLPGDPVPGDSVPGDSVPGDSVPGDSGTAYRLSDRVEDNRLVRFEAGGGGSTVRTGVGRLIAVPDRPPEIEVLTPAPFSEVEAADVGALSIAVEIVDDYAVVDASIVATVASGFGELVEFRERRLAFAPGRPARESGRRRFERTVDLVELGVRPGVELFFHVEAIDNRQPTPNRARSVTHIVRVPGGGTQSVGLSARMPIFRVPEFFRSQRQIILDTEKLLAEETTLTAAEFRRRSESLGLDQRALRMRYGGLLGEEFESGAPITEDADHEEDGELRRLEELDAGGEEGAEQALEALGASFVHEHDSAEIATYFDSEVKAQLKQALAEMWGAEGRLRGIEPRSALPFEYRALRLLKEVQQRSRLYVRKIGFEPPALYPTERRLTGELDEIRTIRRRLSPGDARDGERVASARAVLAAARRWREGGAASADFEQHAERVARWLAAEARVDEAVDLEGLDALRRWMGDGSSEVAAGVDRSTVEAAEAAVWNLLPPPPIVPVADDPVATGLGTRYRQRLLEGEKNR